MPDKRTALARAIRRVHERLRDACLARCRAAPMDELAREAVTSGGGDVTLGIDLHLERLLPGLLRAEVGPVASLVAVFEGQGDLSLVVPEGTAPEDAEFFSIWDLLDGSRTYAYQLRPAWVLTGVSVNTPGRRPRLRDVEVAVQTEVPLLNQRTAAGLCVVKGRPLQAELVDPATGGRQPLALRPSRAASIEGGFFANAHYFDGPVPALARVEEAVIRRVLGPGRPGAARVWHETYLSSAGTLYNLLAGKVRWAADCRPLARAALRREGLELSLTAHPYDVCTAPLLAAAVGAHVTGPDGQPLDAPLTLDAEVAWIAYANDAVRLQVEGPLLDELRRLSS